VLGRPVQLVLSRARMFTGCGHQPATRQTVTLAAGGDGALREEIREDTYGSEMFFMAAGAIFLSLNVAPTEEMILISFQMGALHAVLLMLVSVAALHAIVYTLGFKGEERPPGQTSFWNMFLRYTIVGYAIAVLVALYLLWTFGRLAGTDEAQIASMVTVLAFPGALGAALARLVV
ncbi:MAG: DUF2391 family protein, partial [Sphingomonas sp.]|nr:DUF2391 family protein [Sphingomonas sp.]